MSTVTNNSVYTVTTANLADTSGASTANRRDNHVNAAAGELSYAVGDTVKLNPRLDYGLTIGSFQLINGFYTISEARGNNKFAYAAKIEGEGTVTHFQEVLRDGNYTLAGLQQEFLEMQRRNGTFTPGNDTNNFYDAKWRFKLKYHEPSNRVQFEYEDSTVLIHYGGAIDTGVQSSYELMVKQLGFAEGQLLTFSTDYPGSATLPIRYAANILNLYPITKIIVKCQQAKGRGGDMNSHTILIIDLTDPTLIPWAPLPLSNAQARFAVPILHEKKIRTFKFQILDQNERPLSYAHLDYAGSQAIWIRFGFDIIGQGVISR
jgi:hypothetical protein